MDFDYTEEQKAIQGMVRDFTEAEIAPGAEERDSTGQFPYELYKKLGNLGIIGMRFPKEYGGTNSDFLSICHAAREIARVDVSLAVTLMVAAMGALHLMVQGTEARKEEWKEKYILPVVRGEATCSGAFTEPDAGSDTRAFKTTAVLDGDEWVINGSKAFITNAGLDNNLFVNVLCLTEIPQRQHSFIFVPTGTRGYKVMPKYRKMGWRSSATAELVFEDCRVPAENLLGVKGLGRKYLVEDFFLLARLETSAIALGLAQACFEKAFEYAKQRYAFGKPISKFQHVQSMLVDMALELELSELLLNKATLQLQRGEKNLKMLAMVKYFICDFANKAAYDSVQIFGGIGILDECPVSRYYRDARPLNIADGTTQIMKRLIARELGC